MNNPLPKGSVLALHRMILVTVGDTCKPTAASDTQMEGDEGSTVVNSPERMNP